MEKEVYEVYNLTSAQKSIWNTELFFSGSNINNICGTINLFEPLDFDTLKKAVTLIIEENDNFHTRFFIKEASVYQTFIDKLDYNIEVVDLNTADIDDTPNVGTEESAKFICGVCNRNNELLILIDLNKLLSEDEWQEVANL